MFGYANVQIILLLNNQIGTKHIAMTVIGHLILIVDSGDLESLKLFIFSPHGSVL
jgi:hypothetical protein